jgi:hypothetical protein
MSSVVQLVSDFVFTPYVLRKRHEINNSPPTCDLCDTDDVQDEQHNLFHCANPRVSQQEYTSLFSPTGVHDVSIFLNQNSNKLQIVPP